MQVVKLKDISKQISSGLTPNRSNESFWLDGTINWLKTEQLGERYIYETTEKISEEAMKGTSIKLFPPGTLSIAMYGEGKTRGNVSLLKSEMTTNQACCNIVLDSSIANSEFVYYFLKTQYENLRGLSSGIRKNLNSNDIKEFKITLPDLSAQQKIASILSALDDKIELNNRINAELEQMAKTLYDYWFVQFDFPDQDGKPYKSSGGKMVFSEVLRREIPEGWDRVKLGDAINFEYGKPLKESNRSGKGFPVYGSNGIVGYHDQWLVEGPGIVIGRKGSAGEISWVSQSFYPIDTTYYVTSKIEYLSLHYLYYLLNSLSLKKVESSSAVPGLNRNVVYNFSVAIPNESVIGSFDNLVRPIYVRKYNIEKQNQELSALRDWLLPMLMNGQVKVAEKDEQIEQKFGMVAEERKIYNPAHQT